MKKYIVFVSFIILSTVVAYVMTKPAGIAEQKQTAKRAITRNEIKRDEVVNVGKKPVDANHSKEKINCRECHNCEYPTHQDPCLASCPRTDVSVYHSPDEAPELIVLENLTNRYGSVVFSHKIHAEMSVMSHGCTGCHHYNTTGSVLKCRKCHEEKRLRKDLSKPDLEAAFHRQCMTCHRQWQRTTDCNSCHLPKGREGVEKREMEIEQVRKFIHPDIPEPIKVVYQTEAKKGKMVTFFHDEHTKLFNIPCVNCHRDENCIRCHDVNLTLYSNNNGNIYKKVHKTFEQHHKPCSDCHDTKNCNKCHMDKEMQPFNHYASTGWELGRNHGHARCNKCHDGGFNKKPGKNCLSCHHDFKPGKFNHERTGLKLSESHIEIECESCHSSADFRSKIVCEICHDDKSYPKFLPGKQISQRKK